LRLFVAAGAWLSGLCLILGSVALVAGAAGPAGATHLKAPPGFRLRADTGGWPAQSLRPVIPSPPVGSGGATVVLHTFGGTGDRTTGRFKVAPHRGWELTWSYSCAPRVRHGRLIIREGNPAKGGVRVDAAGSAGRGSTWTYSNVGTHYLVVTTNCGWTARVVGMVGRR
jgi:hypothetical protein